MASGNTTAIDEVVDPAAIQQFTQLQIAGKELRTELVALLETAIKLNATLGGSTPGTFNKNLQASTEATNKIIANNNKQIKNEQAKAAKQEQILNKYLVMLSKQEQARQEAEAKQAAMDAKEIAAAESKQAKLDAIANRKANTQFANSQTPYNPVTSDDNPAVRYEPIITGNENMAISATKSAEAIAVENAALVEQKEVLASLSVAQRANLELLLALQSERAENAAELKALNVEDAASGERLVFLTQRQLELSIAIRETQTELNRQTKEMLAADTSMKKLDQSVLLLRNSYEQLTAAERESTQGQKMLAELQALDAENKALAVSTGNTSKEVGAYEKAIARATSGSQLAATAINVATRSLVRMVVQFALIGVIIEAVSALWTYIKALEIFNDVATTSAIKQQALTDAFTSGDYEKGIENIEKLAANLDLAKTGIVDSDKAINEYNDTIGKTFGYVTNLNDAQKGFTDHSDAYIQAIYLEAAAQAALANASKFAAEQLAKNVELQAEASNIRYDIIGAKQMGFSKAVIQNQKDQVKDLEKEIEGNNKRAIQSYKNTVDAVKDLYKQAGATNPGSSAGADPVNDLRTKIANEQLEHEKIIAQAKINNDKLSYKERLVAVQQFYNASAKIEENNQNAELVKLPANDARREDIIKAGANKLLELQEQTASQRRGLLDKQYKQDQEIIKNNLEKQKDLFKAILDDPNQSYDMKLIALDYYNKKSQELIQANYKEQVKEAGKNSESIKLAEQNKDKAILQLTNETASEKLKIEKENLQKILEQGRISQQDQLDLIDQGSNLAIQALTSVHDKKENALSLLRAKGKISEEKFNKELLALNDQFAIDRISAEIATQQAILAAREGNRDAVALRMKVDNEPQRDIDKFVSDANKGIQPVKNKLSGLGNDLNNAQSKQQRDQANGGRDKKADLEATLDDAKTIVSDINDLIDKGYENQISKLEKIGEKINENAQIEKAAIDRSLDTQANKARRQLVLDAETASQQKNIQRQIAEEKHKQAVADKAAAIAEIILNTAIGVSKVLGQTGIFGLAAWIPVAALGALQLAKVAATPIPQFAKGTPTGGHKGGYAVVGEVGPERIVEPGRPAYYSPGVATMMNLPRGTVVEPYKMLPETPKWTSTRSDNRDVVEAIDRLSRKDTRQKQPRLSGWIEAQRQADAWNGYRASRFK